MKTPADWHPGHPGYPLHLARMQLRTALIVAETTLEMAGAPDPKALVSRALWDLAMDRDAERAVSNVVPIAPPGDR